MAKGKEEEMKYAVPGIPMTNPRGRICVFTGSRPGVRSEYGEAARRLGHLLVARGYGLVYGGGNVGLMAVIADSVLEQRGHVVGVIPEASSRKRWLTRDCRTYESLILCTSGKP